MKIPHAAGMLGFFKSFLEILLLDPAFSAVILFSIFVYAFDSMRMEIRDGIKCLSGTLLLMCISTPHYFHLKMMYVQM